MSRKILGIAAALVILAVVAATMTTSSASAKGADMVAVKDGAVTKLPPVAIGAHAIAGTHLVPPARGALMAILQEEGLPLDATPEQIQAAADTWYARFQKQSGTWVNAEFQEWVQQREAELAAPGVSAMQIQPVTATVFAMAIDFGATETFTSLWT